MDPAVPLHLMNTLGLSAKEMDTILNKKSGLLGISGHNDLRTIINNKVRSTYARWLTTLNHWFWALLCWVGFCWGCLQKRWTPS
jgi:acetate kinase